MIYSAKGRGARPPVTTERELHVGLMISPQKCLLWLGLHGAVLGEGDLADRPESIQMLTITLLFSGITRKGEDRQKSTFNWYVSNCCLTTNDGLCMRVVVLLSRILQAFSIPASPPPPCPVASGRFHRHYWNVDTEDDVTKLSGTERGAEIIDGGGGQRWGRMVVGGRYLAYFSLLVSRSAGSRHWLLRAWIWMLRLVLLLSVSVWLQLPRTRWCHSQGFVNILDKETKSRGRAQRCQSVNRSKNYTTPLYGWVDFYCL